MTTYSTEVLDSINQISPEEWDACIGSAVGISHALLTCYEQVNTRARDTRYVLLRDHERVQAAGVVVRVPDDDVGISRLVLGRLGAKSRPLQRSLCPALICGLVRGPGAPVVVHPGNDAAVWVPRVIDAMEAYAREKGLAMGFYSVTPRQTELVKELRRRGYAGAYGLPEASVEVTWSDQQTYLSTLRATSKSSFKAAKSEIKRFRRSGIVIEQWDGADESRLYDLLKRHHERRNATPFDLPAGFLSSLKRDLGDDCLVYVARKAATAIAVTIVLHRGEDAWLWRVGVDHDADGGNFTYFNLNFYHVFIDAAARGLRRIWCGNGALYAKTRRGCDVALTRFFFKPRSRYVAAMLRPVFMMQQAWYQRKFSPHLSMRGQDAGSAHVALSERLS